MQDGANIAAIEQGTGPAILLISGLGGTARFWEPCLPVLAAHHRIVRLDQRGIAGSSRGAAPCTIDLLAQDCLAVLQACDIESAIIVGHSTGGCIAQTMAVNTPERVQALVLSGTWAQPNRYMHELFKLRSALLKSHPQEYATSAAFLSYEPAWLNANWPTYESALASAPVSAAAQRVIQERIDALLCFDRSSELGRLSMPCLVLGAHDDLMIPSFLQLALSEQIPGSSMHIFNHGGHFFPLTRTSAFLQVIVNWLSVSDDT
jgi:pimeloyl-ACP methyl ester carboxylesterase